MTLEKLKKTYIYIAVLVFNTALMCLCLNGLLFAYSRVNADALAAPTKVPDTELTVAVELSALNYGLDLLRQVYPDLTDPQIIRLLFENTEISFLMCDEEIRFREKPFNGYYFNVDEAGFRWGETRPIWPPDGENFNIFVFGGSTAFGYGERDSKTIPAYLQSHLRTKAGTDKVVVYNFGHYNFFSLQEKWALQSLVEDGFIPDAAIFVDGLNDSWHWNGIPWENSNCSPPLTNRQRIVNTLRCDYGEFCLPMQKIKLASPSTEQTTETQAYPPADDAATNQAILERWLKTKGEIEAIAAKHGFQTLFIIQPIPTYAYDLQYHLFAKTLYDFGAFNRSFYLYGMWEAMYTDPTAEWTTNTLNLMKLGEGKTAPIYLDKFHYTAPFMDEIAGVIADEIIGRGWIQ